MIPELWKIYDKRGNNLNLNGDAYLNIIFATDVGKDATGYAITDPSTQITRTYITNGGWGYDSNTDIFLDYTFSETGAAFQVDASIFYKDVSIFNPEGQNSSSVSSVTIDDSTNYIYPSVTYAGALFLDPISQGLIETEHLTILQETSVGYVTPYDSSNSTLTFRMIGDEEEIKFFTVNEVTQEIIWSNELVFDVSTYTKDQGLQINIGFRSDEEGVYERRLVIYHTVGNIDYPLIELVVNAQSIGQDERYDTLLENFGIYKPKSFPQLFKEADINEDLPDWELLNYKSKYMILEHDKIIPFIGTYKALINAIKWLGYEDIQIKEWFKNVQENKKLSLYIPYDAEERKKTIKYFSPEERRNLKKLNQLSLVYCITRETGEIDEWGNPITENCYEYNLNEILIKLYALKQWLEKNIIGVNARIVDLTGEGIYFERFKNFIYGTQNLGSVGIYEQSLTPLTLKENSELVTGDASVVLTLKEYSETKIEDLNVPIIELARYGWDPSSGYFSPDTYLKAIENDLYYDPSAVFIGSPFSAPFVDLYDIQWRMSVSKEYGVVSTTFATNPLFIYENQIKFYDVFDTSTIFYDVSSNIDITIEQGYLRDPSNDIWEDSIAYSISPDYYIRMNNSTSKTILYDGSYAVIDGSGVLYNEDGSLAYGLSNPTYFQVDGCVYVVADASTDIQAPTQHGYILESSTGDLWKFYSEFSLQTGTTPFLQYAFDDNYKVPLFNINGYKWTDSNGASHDLERDYFLDIIDGKISMEVDASATPSGLIILSDVSGQEVTTIRNFINFNYDTSLNEQEIKLNVTYSSPRMPLFTYDPSDVSTLYYNPDASINLIEDNSTYLMSVNHAGDYNIEIFGWNGQNNQFFNFDRDGYDVWQKYPTINAYIDTSCAGNIEKTCVSTYITPSEVSILINENLYPIFDRQTPLQGLTFEYNSGKPYIQIPSITFFQDLPEKNSIARFFNLTERITSISGSNIVIDPDYQEFYDGDLVNLVQLDKGQYSFIQEASASISGTSPNFAVDNTPSNFTNDTSIEWYILNNTQRVVSNGINDVSAKTFICDISSYSFMENQLIGMLIEDACTGDIWGSSFRVIDVSTSDTSYGYQHTLEGNIPEFILNDNIHYSLTAKHAFSTYSDFQIDVSKASEISNNFKIFLDDNYYHQYYLDNTFVFFNILFDQEIVLQQWYDPSTDNMIGTEFYPFDHSITLDVSTLVIFKSEYDSSNYMLNQKNIWEIRKSDADELLLRVHNFVVPYIFNEVGEYDIQVESYDSYGNLKTQLFEGLIKIN